MERHNVFATKEETKEIKRLHHIAQNTPVIAMSMAHGIAKGGFAGEAWTELEEYIHKCALKHGLPKIKGFYGFDGANNEFLSY